jgi:hypothetical protein
MNGSNSEFISHALNMILFGLTAPYRYGLYCKRFGYPYCLHLRGEVITQLLLSTFVIQDQSFSSELLRRRE